MKQIRDVTHRIAVAEIKAKRDEIRKMLRELDITPSEAYLLEEIMTEKYDIVELFDAYDVDNMDALLEAIHEYYWDNYNYKRICLN